MNMMMNKSYLALVPSLHVEDVWIRILPHLLNGKEHWEQFYSAQQLRKNLITGQQQLWIMVDEGEILGIVLTQIDTYPETKSLRILFLGGKGFKRAMVKNIRSMENWAKEKGATMVDILGRDEWWPLVKDLGYTSPGRVYRKEL